MKKLMGNVHKISQMALHALNISNNKNGVLGEGLNPNQVVCTLSPTCPFKVFSRAFTINSLRLNYNFNTLFITFLYIGYLTSL